MAHGHLRRQHLGHGRRSARRRARLRSGLGRGDRGTAGRAVPAARQHAQAARSGRARPRQGAARRGEKSHPDAAKTDQYPLRAGARRPAHDGPGHAGAAGADARLRRGLRRRKAAAQSRGLLRPRAHDRAAAHGRGRRADRACTPALGALHGDHGRRISGRVGGAGSHLPRRVTRRQQPLFRRRRQAVDLPLPSRRPDDLPRQIRALCGFPRGRARCAAAHPPAGEFPLPPRGAGRCQPRLFQHHVARAR